MEEVLRSIETVWMSSTSRPNDGGFKVNRMKRKMKKDVAIREVQL